MTKNERIYLSSPHMSGEESLYIEKAFSENWIAPLGPNVDKFEKEIADYVGVGHAAAVSSGTAAIHLALELLGVKEGDIVFCSTLTFVASANPILYKKAKPIFIDSEPSSWNMSPDALEEAFSYASKKGKLPKAVIVVNLYGQSADLDPIKEICDKYDVPIIEDAAESLGATYKGRASGSIGKFGVFSFNGNKIITTSGGGMLVSDDEGLINRARFLSTQARDPAVHYQHTYMGYNYRMSNILAGIGRGQLKVLNNRVEARREVFSRYFKALSDIDGIKFMPEAIFGMSNRWLTALTVDQKKLGFTRSDIIHGLEVENIEARPVWKPLHLQPLFKGSKYFLHKGKDVSKELFQSGLCLPSGSNLTEEDQSRVIKILKKLIKK
ncbi:aminotransferase class I/II-fold pyridoxal phosphate-dependent enzyme [Halalkalibacterium halodurans]|uniref:DegT/DnrJ/EryC1/StrS family aminotransferase n=1 Tax=Halalkalibacterium halodurans TaxID=86665 RepID=UPI002E1BE72C|nr:aminotransferase class I/II-fold pyridoxal phosphate-dependent enzyme [Halalkalibacterium halodurans]MED4123436.1 aminotransferase class I/II-fold pyridoxal phosphate-dependent enzyme [Halalkalibacterium halodurans]